jgi:transposase
MVYSEAFRSRMVQRMTGPKALTASALEVEVGVTQPTLSRWLRDASIVEAVAKPKTERLAHRAKRVSEWSAEEKLSAVVEAASLGEAELGAWLRRRGLREEDLASFRADALAGLTAPKRAKTGSAEQKRIKELERDLKRKDAALAETAALLVLRKKAVALWGEEGEDT